MALFQTIQGLAKTNHLLQALVALGSIHENRSVIWEGHVQKRVANIHLPKRPAQVQSQSKKQLKHNGLESGRVGGDLVIKVLLITTDNKLSLVLLRLDFVHHLQERLRTPAGTAETRTQVNAERQSRPDISSSIAVHHWAASGPALACLKD